jgi:hypothetical protein
MKSALLGAAALILSAVPASAAITVDGVLDGDYGAPTAFVAYNPAAPNSNFQNPTNEADSTSYNIYGKVADGNLYGFWQANPNGDAPNAPFAAVNLYLDTDPDTASGSDLGFEITNDRAFRPGVAGYSAPLGLSFVASGNIVEFAIPLSMLTGGIASLPSFGANKWVQPGGRVRFQLSQAFGYSVAGGAAFYGDNRLGSFRLPAVPEPATWAMMIGGFGLAGAALRRRPRTAVAA